MERLKFTIGTNENADFHLREEHWNDYGFCTLYKIFASKKLTNENDIYLGNIHIMEKGQRGGDKWLQITMGKGATFEELPASFYSMSTELTMYEHLLFLLTPQQRTNFIEGLHMIMGQDKNYEKVKNDKCFNTSLLRMFSSFEECERVLSKAKEIMECNLDVCKIYNDIKK